MRVPVDEGDSGGVGRSEGRSTYGQGDFPQDAAGAECGGRAGGAVPIGVPLAALVSPLGTHSVQARLGTDAKFSMLVDGVGYDEDGVAVGIDKWVV